MRAAAVSVGVGVVLGLGLVADSAARGPGGRGPLSDIRAVGSFEAVPCEASPGEQSIVMFSDQSGQTVIEANGIPDHSVGRFPNAGNPNTISAQSHRFTIPKTPSGEGGELRRSRVGVAINGVPLDPGTAEYYNNDRSSGWRYEALSGAINLGVDCNNAHVQPTGTYHYHGIPEGLLTGEVRMELVGYVADGYPLYARYGIGEDGTVRAMKPSFRLKAGERGGGPGGAHDGTFVQDYEYVEGLGDLDACNGRLGPTPEFGETYHYVLTDDFPFVPRCTVADQDDSFALRGGPPRDGRGHPPPHHRR